MPESPLTLRDVSTRLFKANAIKFGDFVVGTGATTPIYFDFRVIVSYPELLKDLSILLSERIHQLSKQNQNRTIVCGIPYSAVPVTALVSQETGLPMVMKRKQAKDYGTRQLIEGVWAKGDTCILVDDVIMFGDSIIETVDELREIGLECTDVVVICDRQQGATAKVAKKGVKVHSLLTVTEIMEYLLDLNYVTQENCDMVQKYLAGSQVS